MDTHNVSLAPRQSSSRIEPRPWAVIERHMEHARDLRSQHCAALFTAALRRVRRAFDQLRATPRAALPRILAVCCVVPLAAGAVMDRAAAQEAKQARLEAPRGDGDRERLAALGLAPDTIEQETNVEVLWRAVRELVLPGRVSEAMQQRILRRVWTADPAINGGSFVDSAVN